MFIKPIVQLQVEASFTKMLEKKLALINPTKMAATQVKAHFLAYLGFPKTNFNEAVLFNDTIRLDEIGEVANISLLESKNFVSQNRDWLRLKKDKKNTTFLKCSNGSLLEVKIITTSKGKKINLAGVSF